MRQQSQTQNPNITKFREACEKRGLNLNDPCINEDALAAAYIEGKPYDVLVSTDMKSAPKDDYMCSTKLWDIMPYDKPGIDEIEL